MRIEDNCRCIGEIEMIVNLISLHQRYPVDSHLCCVPTEPGYQHIYGRQEGWPIPRPALLCENHLDRAEGIFVGMRCEFWGYVDVPLLWCPVVVSAPTLEEIEELGHKQGILQVGFVGSGIVLGMGPITICWKGQSAAGVNVIGLQGWLGMMFMHTKQLVLKLCVDTFIPDHYT